MQVIKFKTAGCTGKFTYKPSLIEYNEPPIRNLYGQFPQIRL